MTCQTGFLLRCGVKMDWKEAAGATGLELLELAADQIAELEGLASAEGASAEEAMAKFCSALGVSQSDLTPAQLEFFNKFHRRGRSQPTVKGFIIPHEHRVPNVKF